MVGSHLNLYMDQCAKSFNQHADKGEIVKCQGSYDMYNDDGWKKVLQLHLQKFKLKMEKIKLVLMVKVKCHHVLGRFSCSMRSKIWYKFIITMSLLIRNFDLFQEQVSTQYLVRARQFMHVSQPI